MDFAILSSTQQRRKAFRSFSIRLKCTNQCVYVEVYITQSPWRAHHTPISLQARVQCTSRVPQTGPAAFAGPAHQGLACRARPNTGRTGGSLRPVQDLYEPHRVGPGQSDADDAASDRQGFWSRYPGAVRRTRRARTSAGCGGGTPPVSRKSVSITGTPHSGCATRRFHLSTCLFRTS